MELPLKVKIMPLSEKIVPEVLEIQDEIFGGCAGWYS